jgi:DNA processing protein
MNQSTKTTEILRLGLSESELIQSTLGLVDEDSVEVDSAIELLAAVTFSSITEPGDQMMGLLIERLGRVETLNLLVSGFEVNGIMSLLKEVKDDFESKVGDLRKTLSDSRERWLPRLNQRETFKILSHCQQFGIKAVLPEEQLWPKGLNDLGNNAPRIIYVLGNKSILSGCRQSVSVVGSRNATSYGLKITEGLVGAFSEIGWGTVSGGALGIDANAHTTSLEQGIQTVAVMAGGVDWFYPKQNMPLFIELRKDNAIISELPPGVSPTRWRFLQRNRLIAALTPVTVVVEAALRSGAIKTANDALLLDRELFAVPGPIDSLTSQGTNELINSGKAKPISSPQDLIQRITGDEKQEISENVDYLSANQTRALDALRAGSLTNEELRLSSGLTEHEAEAALMSLQSRRLVERNNSKWLSSSSRASCIV